MRPTRIEVRADPQRRRAGITLAGGIVAARLTDRSATGARISLVATTATLLAYDQIAIEVVVGPGAWLDLSDVAATVAYDGRGAPARWAARIEVADGGLLLWHGEPLVVADGADVLRTTDVVLTGTARAVLRETLVLGRSGEVGGSLTARTRVTRDGAPLLAEDLDLRVSADDRRGADGVLGGRRVVDTLSVLGARGPRDWADRRAEPADGIRQAVRFELDGPGTVLRHLSGAAHESPLAAYWRPWRAWALQSQPRQMTVEAAERG